MGHALRRREAVNTKEKTFYKPSLIARVCHEANRAYCEGIGDASQPLWNDAPDWQRSSAISGVEMILKDPDTYPEKSHEGWLEEKRRTGWKYGPVKDPEKKEHPCFLPYNELPANQKIKDHLFGAIARILMKEME